MKVKAVTKYVFKGEEYKSLKDIKEKLHDTIGLEVLDKIARTCPLEKHKDYLKLLELLCSKEVRDVLTECFSVEFEDVLDSDWREDEVEIINVLDIKN